MKSLIKPLVYLVIAIICIQITLIVIMTVFPMLFRLLPWLIGAIFFFWLSRNISSDKPDDKKA